MASEYFYAGKQYSLDPTPLMNPYGSPTGYNPNFSSLSNATDARTANQLKEVSEHLNTGIKNIEVGAIGPDVFESIPKEHFKEMNRMAKLAGAELTLHAPMVDPTGISQQGWSKLAQQSAEKQLWNVIETTKDLNPKGSVITYHATSGFPAPSELKVKDENGKERTVALTVIDKSNGKIGQIGEEERYFKSKDGKPSEFNAQAELDRINHDSWMGTLSNLTYYTDRGSNILDSIQGLKESQTGLTEKYGQESIKELTANPKLSPGDKEILDRTTKEVDRAMGHGAIFFQDAYRNLVKLYDDVYKGANSEDKKKLQSFASEMNQFEQEGKLKKINQNPDPETLKSFAEKIERGVKTMKEITPIIYTPVREFAIEKAAETTANLAFRAYNEFEKKGKNAPIIALENHPAGQGLLTTGEELRDVIKEAHNKFVEKAKSQGMSESEARKTAERLIGATWDVGHINMIRRYGYGDEDLVKQTKAVAPFVKKIHLADNFGFEHTEIPMGMGNVPLKKMMDQIGKEGYDIKKVIEAGNWWQHFSQGSKANNPLVPTLSNMGVPVYMPAYTGGGNWNMNSGYLGGYFAGYGTMLPENNFQMYGAGFSTLPMELGGNIPSKDSKFSGTPMA